jgi:uncharacterized membrane protein YtjA (UPF0391 family)
MFGWMILFALMTMLGGVLTVTNPASVSASSASVVLMFGLLFLIGLLTRLVRGKAW